MKNLRNKLLCALAATAGVFIPAQVSAQESAQIAAWTFSGGYERVDEGTSAYFTPSGGQWAESGVVWFKDYAPYIYPTAKADGQDGAVLDTYLEANGDLWAPYGKELPRTVVGSIVGTHIGPGGVAVAYFLKD